MRLPHILNFVNEQWSIMPAPVDPDARVRNMMIMILFNRLKIASSQVHVGYCKLNMTVRKVEIERLSVISSLLLSSAFFSIVSCDKSSLLFVALTSGIFHPCT